MKKIAILFLFFVIVSCETKKDNTIKTITWKLVEEISLPVADYYNMPWGTTIIETDTANILMFYQDNVVLAYNLSTKKIISKMELPERIDIAQFRNSDSLFVLLLQEDYSYDSCLYLFDINGKVKKVYSFYNDSNFRAFFKPGNKDSSLYTTNIDYLYSKNDNFYFSVSKLYFDLINDSSFNAVKTPIVGHFNIKSEKFYFDSIFQYPDLKPNQLLSKGYLFPPMQIVKDKLLVGFFYTPDVYIYSIKTKSLEQKELKSLFLDSIKYSGTSPYELENFYGYFYYDKYKEMLYRYVYPVENIQTLQMFDTNFNIIGESILPKDMRRLLITEDGYYSVNLKKTFSSEDKIIIDKYEISVIDVNKDSFIISNNFLQSKDTIDETCEVITQKNDIQKVNDLNNYLLQKINENSFAAMIVPVFRSCHNCVDMLLTNYGVNLKSFSENHVYLIAVGENVAGIKDKLNEFGISTLTPTVIIDTNTEVYENTFYNPSLEHLVITKNNKVEIAESYYPDNLDTLMLNIVNFVKNE